jgi:ribosome-associated protein
MSASPLRVGEWFAIRPDELRWQFDTSGGPGGQHANRSATRVELSWDVTSSDSIDAAMRARLLERLGTRAPGGVVSVAAADTRSQWRNRAMARRRLEEVLLGALRPERDRVATAPTATGRRRRAEAKRRRSVLKRLRRTPEEEE